MAENNTALVESMGKTPVTELMQFAEAVAKSGYFGQLNKEQALVLLGMADAEGVHPMQAFLRYAVIKGKPSKYSAAMLADFKRRGGHVKWLETNNKIARATFTKDGDSVTVQYTVDDAKLAELTSKDNWRRDPESMLVARVITRGLRRIDPESTGLLYTDSEVSTFEDKTQDRPRVKVNDLQFDEPEAVVMPSESCDVLPEDKPSKPFQIDEQRAQVLRDIHTLIDTGSPGQKKLVKELATQIIQQNKVIDLESLDTDTLTSMFSEMLDSIDKAKTGGK